MKILKWLDSNILFVISLFLLVFIPLYPKLPLVGIQHTWVYIRFDDIAIVAAVAVFLLQLLRRKASLKTPLTIPIFIFWLIGIFSTVFAIFFIFPHLANVFPNVAILSSLRRVEYLLVFFIAYSAVKSKDQVKYVVIILMLTLIAVCLYGFGQRGFIVGFEHRFPAFSTMNEEFAKGIPLLISATNRVQSTFAGHYDLAAYLVMLIPIMGSLIFAVKNIFGKISLFATGVAGVILLLMTASRVSFAVYLLTVIFMLILQKQKKYILPVIIASILLLHSFQGLSQRFASTVKQVDLMVDARTLKPVGVVREENKNGKKSFVIDDAQDNGEQGINPGSGYIIPVNQDQQKTTTSVSIKKIKLKSGKSSTDVTTIEGDFIIKRALAYDISFTTRFQGEWPNAINAFKRNILFGTGYSSISLATDNNYLRMLGETGVLGLSAFIFIFIILGIYTFRTLPFVDDNRVKALVLGIIAGIFGLGLNAILIDVFEASKVAYVLWILVGIVIGFLHLYKKDKINYLQDLKNIFTSTPAIIIYLFVSILVIFWPSLNNYFVADDFTWLRWIADCKKILYQSGELKCLPERTILASFFTDANGFFYRPGMKIFFYYLYTYFWLVPLMYHFISLLIHFGVTSLLYIFSLKILKNKFFAFIAAVLFLTLSIHAEAIMWISSVGHLFASFFILLSLIFYLFWKEKKNIIYFIFAVLSMIAAPLFHEMGIIAPILVIVYSLGNTGIEPKKWLQDKWYYLIILITIGLYIFLRSMANSKWSMGDYTYNILKLPFNFFGNIFGYMIISLVGGKFMQTYDTLRSFGRGNIALVAIICFIFTAGVLVLFNKLYKRLPKTKLAIVYIALLLFIVPLLPFLGLGNISPRYVYLASSGVTLLLSYLLMQVHYRLSKKHLYLSIGFVVLFVAFFMVYNLVDLKKNNADWNRAGNITHQTLTDFNETYFKPRTFAPNPVFYFTNVPIRKGDAWVFPVGLSDALWFTFQNENLTVHQVQSLKMAFDESTGSSSAKVFEFDNDGNVEEVIKSEQIVPAK